jgi:hypothetical protein
MTIRVLCTTALAVLGFGILGPTAHANDADGIARVSHAVAHPQYQAPPQGPYYVASGQGQHRQPPNPTYWTWMPLPFHGCCDTCGDPNCPGQKGFWTFPIVRWVLDPDYYTVAPDYGWSPPAKVPVRRQNVTYQNYGPNAWTGNGTNGQTQTAQRRPIIATPTDTTQLGTGSKTLAYPSVPARPEHVVRSLDENSERVGSASQHPWCQYGNSDSG